MKGKSIVASGHPETSNAAASVLEQGGNAFDACIAAACTACVSEPLLASLGGGGFMLAQSGDRDTRLYDFFAQTPAQKNPDCSYRKIEANFGDVTQDFYIGLNTVAVPGVPAGLARIHAELATMPMRYLVEPALSLASEPVRINAQQASVIDILRPIIHSHDDILDWFSRDGGDILVRGDHQNMAPLMASLDALALEGDGIFYRGEIARQISGLSVEEGGHLIMSDLEQYQCELRQPIRYRFQDAEIWSNPPPSGGGALIANTLVNYQRGLESDPVGPNQHASILYRALDSTDRIKQSGISSIDAKARLPVQLESALKQLEAEVQVSRGTTQISIIDADGNLASMTLSNGEGCGRLVAGGGLHLNNFLGEEDLMPAGVGSWRPGVRLSSMMSPTLMRHRGRQVVIGSAGSNRIRSAIAQVLIHLVCHDMSLQDAIAAPRMHVERGQVDLEPGLPELDTMHDHAIKRWNSQSLFFGGVNAVRQSAHGEMTGCADIRRGGEVRLVDHQS